MIDAVRRAETEASRLQRIEEFAEKVALGRVERFRPGTFGCHELLDRASLLMNATEEWLLDHPTCFHNPEWFALATRASEALIDLYQAVGEAHLDAPGLNPRGRDGANAKRICRRGRPLMSYSVFTLDSACRTFGLDLNETENLFAGVSNARVTPFLRAVLDQFVPLGTSIHTEKARSEFIVAPILAEVRKLMNHRVSLFSGVEFNVDPDQKLNGVCNFILAASPSQLILRAPVLMIVEAKNDNVKSGLGQCVAEMVAARLFNERAGEGPSAIHGAVTTGSVWKFLKLDGGTVFVDHPEYYLDHVDTVLAILVQCVGGDPATAGAAA